MISPLIYKNIRFFNEYPENKEWPEKNLFIEKLKNI